MRVAASMGEPRASGDSLESGASCRVRVYVCCCMPGLGGPQGILWGQLSGIGEPAVGYRCLRRMMWKEGEDDVGGEEDDEEDGKVGHLA